MTTIQPNYMTQQPIQTVAPTAGTPNHMVNPNQPQTTYTQQPVQHQVVNTTDPAQLQQIQQRQQQLQQQYVGQIPQTTPQQQTSTAPQYDVSTPSSINRMVQDFSNEANDLITKTNVPPAPQQIQQPVQQTTTQVAQTQVPQQTTQTVQPATGTATQTQVASNPQVATTTAQPQQSKPLTVGSSDGQGNILMSNPQTGQLQWMPEEQALTMYQNGSNENRGKVQLQDGSWVDKSTVERVTEKLQARLKLKELLDQGKITPEEFKLAGGEQDLSSILGGAVADRNAKARERMKAAVGGGASETSLADLGGASSPYERFTPSAGGGEAAAG
jgi:hypothetical protein